MARLQVEVRPGVGVSGYSLFVDGVPVTMGAGHRGEAPCAGRCGDGSSHALLYSFSGKPGATLRIVLRCREREVCRVAPPPVPLNGLRKAGRELFDL
jgi:hypothetical protein